MSDLNLLLGIAGIIVTMLVIAGMFLITPGGVESAPAPPAEPEPAEAGAEASATRESIAV